ncbi:lipoate--protein ligase family protein [Aureibacillus halotolerans]|uniref:Octanoyl-[GcvH]:protein N-octanoyltransferase n=1 Tax=Aureibacillus halotolerans TaxID=1508390 RepID=A0A4R6TZI6_9BACI|nr:lipoate--protein ligase family protein [Aureibacillus halotolerans]TDQ38776.1 octanoyl-[GcvH]:protein N-octanoyltransferase [Aureibacillus halotolerans]
MNKTYHPLLLSPTWRVVDQSLPDPSFRALESFAIDDTLCEAVGKEHSAPILRSWVHHETIVLGIQDARLPGIEQAVRSAHTLGYDVIVRNSGGLAVALDEDVLNISLICKEPKSAMISQGYESMVALLRAVLAKEGIAFDVGEIEGSYCPGSYDLSIHGRKFAGISQRRIRGAVAVQVYLGVKRSGAERAKIVQALYDIAVQDKSETFVPTIKPEVMGSLEELTGIPLSHSDLMQHVYTVLADIGATVQASALTEAESERLVSYRQRILDRNTGVYMEPIK